MWVVSDFISGTELFDGSEIDPCRARAGGWWWFFVSMLA